MPDIIDTLSGLDDTELAKKLGFNAKLADFRKHLAEAAALSGKPRDAVADRINHMLTPSIHGEEVRWAVEDAKRDAVRDAKAELLDTSPSSIAPPVED